MKVELKIIDLLAKDMEKRFTINEIARVLKGHYSFVHKVVDMLAKEGVIVKNKAGKAYLCSLNMENEKTIAMIILSEIERKEEFYTENKGLKLILIDFLKSLEPRRKNIIAVVLFGSYAKGSATKESDIDILLICKVKFDIEKITKEIYAKYGKELVPIIMSLNSFKKQTDKPIIKEIIKTHYVLHGAENFVNLVFRK